jgi:hypothetical protein
MTKNEPLVANSITIPPKSVDDYYKFFDIEEDKKYIEDILTHYYNGSPKPITQANEQFNNKQVELPKTNKVEPLLSNDAVEPMKYYEEEIIQAPAVENQKKKPKTLKNRAKLRIVESTPVEVVSSNKIGEPMPLQTYLGKIFNPVTKRFVKDTPANRKKIAKNNTLKTGGKPNNKTIKKKYYYKTSKIRTIKHKQHKFR